MAASARASYFFSPNRPGGPIPWDIGLGGFLALGCAFYTAIIAVRVSKADEADRLSVLAFLGVMIPVGLQWVGTTAVA